METYTGARALVENPRYDEQRRAALGELDFAAIDRPIVDIVKGFVELVYCFTLQSCFGHFLYDGQRDMHNLDPVPVDASIEVVEYRIAYLALCVENTAPGRELLEEMAKIAATNPEYIQFGSADWFWERQVNSYVLQVEPREHVAKDRCIIDRRQALAVEQVRNRFFEDIAALLTKRQGAEAA